MREEDTVVNRVKGIERALRDIKSVQFSGQSNVLTQLSQTGSTWDIDSNLSGGEVHNRLFIFTADTQKAPFVSFHPHVRVDNVDYNGTVAMRVDSYIDFAITGSLSTVDFEKSVGFVMSFDDFDFDPPFDTYNIKVKMRCISSDAGVITVYTL